MPFTFSHPAIVIPLARLSRKWFSLTGLVIGSMMPDVEYFLRMRVKSTFSHSIPGLFYFDIPAGLIMCFIFHGIIRNSLINNLPIIFRKHLEQFNSFNWPAHFKRTWPIVIVSLFIGAASHIFWDGFTHPGGFFVSLIPALQNLVSIPRSHIPLYKIIQHASSILGTVIILFAIQRMPSTRVSATGNILSYWLKVLLVAVVVVALKMILGSAHNSVGDIIVSCISGGLLGLILAPAVYSKYNPSTVRKTTSM